MAEVEKLRIGEDHQTARYRIAAVGASLSPIDQVVHELESGRRRPIGDSGDGVEADWL